MFIQNENFKPYLAGLLEGDGSFVVPSIMRDSKNRLRYVKIRVAFVKKDKPLAKILKSYYGGYFEENDGENFIVWNITKKDQILVICSHINGYLRTPKINDFHKLIEFMRIQDPSINVKVLPLNETPIDSNAWLAGFSDADSNFNLIISKKKNNKKRIQLQFRIEVKRFYTKHLIKNSENYSDFTPICNVIAQFFDLGLYHRTRKEKYHTIIISTTSVHTNAKVIKYFETFPLFSSKYLDYLDWKTIHKMQEKKLHLTPEGWKICEEIRQNYNKNRHKFSWNHLNHFYLPVNEK